MRRQLFCLLSLLAATALSRGNADAATCRELNDLWREHFHSGFAISWKLDTFQCPSSDEAVARAIYDIYKPRTSVDFYDWASKLTSRTLYESNCKKGAVATMTPDGTLRICTAFFGESRDWRAGAIVHEAAHAEPDDPGHVTCAHGSSRGSLGGCDQVFHEDWKGSGYNRQFYYYWKLLDEANYNELSADTLRYTMRYMVLNRFNEVTNEQVRKWAGN